jgi:integrase
VSTSVDIQPTANGKYQVRWRQDGHRRARTVTRSRDADRFALRLRQLLEGGGLVRLDEDLPSLAEFVETWWEVYAIPSLAPKTRDVYASVWEKHCRARIGGLRLRQITPAALDLQLLQPMRRAGAKDPVIIKTLTMLQSVMALAVVHHSEVLPTNPVALLRKPRQKRRDAVPVWPTTVERMRVASWEVGENGARRAMSLRDKIIVAVLAYAGLRPEELLALEWRDIREDIISVERAISAGELRSDDREKRHDRRVDLLAPLAQDLREWRLACGRPGGRTLVFPRADATHWRETDWRNWRRRVYQPAAKAVGLDSRRPYDLRGSFASLLIWQGRTVVDVAEQLGHTPETCLRYYARLFRDAPAERIPAEQAIREARNADQQRLAV